MADLLLRGAMATVQLTGDPEDGQTIATCIEHSTSDGRLAPPGNCDWVERYDTLDDAAEYAVDHADTGRRDCA